MHLKAWGGVHRKFFRSGISYGHTATQQALFEIVVYEFILYIMYTMRCDCDTPFERYNEPIYMQKA